MVTKATTLYIAICKTYFPKWSPWEFRCDPSWGDSGYCNRKEKIIFFGSINPKLIIHEICHAMTRGCHGKQWQTRMMKAAITAETIDPELSTQIIEEVNRYIKSINEIEEKLLQNMLYDQIRDAINELYFKIDEIGINHIVNHILSENGAKKEWDMPLFNKMFRRGMGVAEKALRERREDERLKQRFLTSNIQ